MFDNMQKISRVVFQPIRDLQLRIHLKLIKERQDGRKENFHNVFTYGDKNYLKVDLQSFFTLEIPGTGSEWAKDKSIVVDQKNIYQLIRGLKKTIDDIYDGGVFAVDKEDNIVIYKDKQEEYTNRIYNLNYNQRIVLTPAIIYDETEVSYEGVIMYINKTANVVEMSIDVLESLYYTLKKADLFVYSQLLLNYYVATLKNEQSLTSEDQSQGKPKQRKHHPLFAPPPITEEHVKSNVPKEKEKENFFNFDTKSE